MKFNLEEIFTISEYNKFINAIKNRQEYEFLYAKQGTYLPHPKTRIYIKIDGSKCDNGIWADNYLYSIGAIDARNGYTGHSSPYDPVNKVLKYEEILEFINSFLGFKKQTEKQLNIFDVVTV